MILGMNRKGIIEIYVVLANKEAPIACEFLVVTLAGSGGVRWWNALKCTGAWGTLSTRNLK